VGHSAHGVVTGKPVSIGGPRDVSKPTARGLLYRGRGSLQAKEDLASGATVAIRLGTPGATAARLFAEKKQKS